MTNDLLQRIKTMARAERQVSDWALAHRDDEDPPVRWEWVDKDRQGRDSLDDIVVTFRSGRRELTAPALLNVEAE